MDFTNPHFADPQWLWLAVAGPVLLGLLQRYAARARRSQIALLATPELLGGMLRSHSPARRLVKNAMLCVAVGALGIALARPQWGEQVEQSESYGEDVLFLLDCSRSMLAADVTPNRLTRAKLAILDFAQQYGGGRVGLVAFAGQAFLQCPLTFDYDAFRDTVAMVDERTIPVPGTDIGRGLQEGYAAIEKNDRQKIMILISDGEDLEKSGLAQARALAEKGVTLFTLGVGTPAGQVIHIPNERGERVPLRDARGEVVESRLDEGRMRGIAEATHGRYQPLGALGEGISKIRMMLESSEGEHRLARTRTLGVDRFHIPLAIGLVLLVVESLLGTRRRSREPSTPAAAEPSYARLAALFVFLAGAIQAVAAGNGAVTPLAPREAYNEGTRRLNEGKLREAETALEVAVVSNDEKWQPLALYNLGHVRFQSGKEALKDGPNMGELAARNQAAAQWAGDAIESADSALAREEIMAIVRAYQQGRGARKELKAAMEAVQRAMNIYGAILLRWQRASGDFKSAHELRPDYDKALFNGQVIDRHIAELVDKLKMMEQGMKGASQKQQELKQRMEALRKRMPEGQKGEEEDEEEDEQKGGKEPNPEEQEKPGRKGREMSLTPEEALRLLESLRVDLNRKYSVSNQKQDSKNRAGRDW